MKHKTNFLSRLFTLYLFPFLSIIITLTAFSTHAYGAQVTLTWNSVAESTGYKVYYGSATRTYNAPVDVGTNTGHTLELAPGNYFFALTAYNEYGESGYSEEVTAAIDSPVVTFSITASAGQNGSISPTGQVTVNQGSSQTFTLTPTQNYHVADLLVDGVSVGAVTSYTFSAVTANHTISANFAIDTYTITASAGANGSISPSGTVTVNRDASQAVTITPATNYHVSSVLVDGVSVGAVTSYTFSAVTANHTISASFAIDTYTITASAGANGSISPSGTVTVNRNASQTVTITPATNYHVSSVLVDGVSVGALTSYTFSAVTANHTISASFAIDTYTITASAGANGSISPSGTVTVNRNASQTVTITPATNYHVSSVLVDGVSVGALTSYTFSNIVQAHTISATFSIDSHIIKSISGQNGGVFPSGDIPVNHGSNQSFTITPAQNYHVLDLIVDGVSVGTLTSYTFSTVIMDHTISATFAIDTHIIATLSGDQGSISPNGPVTVNHGANQLFVITANENYHVADVIIDGASVGAVTSYTFENVTANHTIGTSFEHDNQPPVADAGPDQKVDENTTVTVSGANSKDIDENDSIVSYSWVQVSGQTVALLNPAKAETTFTSPSVGPEGAALVFQLTVTDSKGLSASDSCIINVSSVNLAPIANAGPDQALKEGDSVTLDGSGSSDPDNDSISYLWEQVSGPQVGLSSSTSVRPTFTAGDVSLDGVSYTFQLTVTDSGGLKATDTCIVNISGANVPPVANAGVDQTVVKGNTVTLDGSGSTDSDNNITSYRWTQTSGSPVTFSDSSAIKPVFTVPEVGQDGDSLIFQLTVADSGGLENSDTCTVSVSAMRPPVPDIKANGQDGPITVAKGQNVSITVALDPGDYVGQKVDWWITSNTPGNVWNSYIWARRLWVSGIRVSYQAGLTKVSRTVLNSKRLPAGDYTFYFAVDNNMDQKPDSTWSDSVIVHIK